MSSFEDEMQEMGELLIEEGLITQEELDAAKHASDIRGTRMASLLSNVLAIRRAELAAFIGVDYAIPKIADLRQVPISADAVRHLPREVAQKWAALPIAMAGGILIVAIARPTAQAVREIRHACGGKLKVMRAEEAQIKAAIERYLMNKPVEIPGVEPVPPLQQEFPPLPSGEEAEVIPLFSENEEPPLPPPPEPAPALSKNGNGQRVPAEAAMPISRTAIHSSQPMPNMLSVVQGFEETHLSGKPIKAQKL